MQFSASMVIYLSAVQKRCSKAELRLSKIFKCLKPKKRASASWTRLLEMTGINEILKARWRAGKLGCAARMSYSESERERQ